MSAAGIVDYLDALADAGLEMHSLMVVRRGHVVAEGWWASYASDRRHLVYSISKSFTSLAAGIAHDEGAFDLDDRVVDHFAELADDDVDDRVRRLLVRHVLSMATGHERDTIDAVRGRAAAAGDPDLLRAFLTIAPEREPGTFFTYDQLASHAVARLIERHAGSRLLDYLRPRLFEPLGITEAAWIRQGEHDLGYSGLYVRTESLAKLGHLLLQGGKWGERQIVSSAWVGEATRVQQRNDPPEFTLEPDVGGSSDWRLGYGFQFWVGRHGYRGDGAFGQFCLVWPEEDVVVATTACTTEMALELDLAYRHLLPAVCGEGPVGRDADAALATRLDGLAVDLPPDTAGEISGPFDRVGDPWAAADLRSITLVPDDDGWLCRLGAGREGELPIGRGEWREGLWPVGGVPFASAGGRRDDGRFEAHLRMIETPHHLVLEAEPATGTFTAGWNEDPLHGPDPAGYAV